MKKLLLLFLCILTLSLFTGCDFLGDEDFSAPEVMAPSELPASSATSYPSGEAESLSLISDAMEYFYIAMNNQFSASPNQKGTVTTTSLLNWQGNLGAGTVDFSGTLVDTETGPEDDFTPQANTTYNDLIRYATNLELAGTITGATVSDGLNTYTLNGEIISDTELDMNVDVITGSSTVDINMDLSVRQRYGMAMTVLRDDGVGAKYILTFACDFGKNNITLENPMELFEEFGNQLENQTATLLVYNDNNEEIGRYSCSLMDLSLVTNL